MTSKFSCGCDPDAPSVYCDEHLTYGCHTFGCGPEGCGDPDCPVVAGECPKCRLRRFRSVNLDSRATPTRRER